jgi:hypothetical protein
MNVIGVSCSTVSNVIGLGPGTGNLWVQSRSNAPQYYPSTVTQNGLLIYTGSSNVLQAYCYNSGNSIIATPIGSSVTGYVWINYTSVGLPTAYYTIQKVIGFTATSG